MTTTALFVELVVIGAGAMFWLGLLILNAVDAYWLDWERAISIPVLIMLLPVTYTIGIIVDRLSDRIFRRWDGPICDSIFEKREDYHRARTYVYTHATREIVNLFEYGRSRLRVCRSWSLNFAVLAIMALIFLWSRLDNIAASTRAGISLIVFLLLITAAISSWYAWRMLATNDYRRLVETEVLLVRASRQDLASQAVLEPEATDE